MKQAIKTLFLIVFVLAATVARAEGLKVGHIDMQRVFAESNAGKEAREQYAAKAKSYQDQLNVTIESNKKLKEEIDTALKQVKKGQKPSQTILDKQKKYGARERELQSTLAGYQKELKEYDGELTRKLMEEFSPLVEQFASANNYDYLIRNFDALLFANKKNDVTNTLISAFNNKKTRP